MTTAKKHNVFKNIVQYLFLLLYIVCAVLIFVESAMPGSKSAKQSNDFTGLFEDEINDNYDSQRIKEIKDFGVSFYKDKNESNILDLSNSTFYVGDTIYYNLLIFLKILLLKESILTVIVPLLQLVLIIQLHSLRKSHL